MLILETDLRVGDVIENLATGEVMTILSEQVVSDTHRTLTISAKDRIFTYDLLNTRAKDYPFLFNGRFIARL